LIKALVESDGAGEFWAINLATFFFFFEKAVSKDGASTLCLAKYLYGIGIEGSLLMAYLVM
jgi:hypothetical protein